MFKRQEKITSNSLARLTKKRLFRTLSLPLSLSITLFSPLPPPVSPSLLIHEIREAPKECNHPGVNVQHIPDISPSWLRELRQTALFLPLQLIFYLWGDEDTQLRGAVPGDEEQGDATHRFPFSPSSLPHIKSCHHHLSFVIKDCLSASDGHLLLLMSTNMEGMIRRILTVTNFKYVVSCYQ